MLKYRRYISLVLALLLVVLSFTSCGKKDEPDEFVDIETTVADLGDKDFEFENYSSPNVVVNEKVRIGIVLSGKNTMAPGNNVQSNIFNYSVNNVVKTSNYLDNKCFNFAESVDPNNKEATINALKKLISERSMYIILTDPKYADHIYDFARENHNVSFMVYNFDKVNKDLPYKDDLYNVGNIITYSANITGAEYLAGIVSAYKSKEIKSNTLGFLVGDSEDLTILNAFAEGVKSVDSNLKIKANVSKNPKADAQALISSGCKIIASDFYNTDIAAVATSAKAYFCGFGSEQYTDKSSMLCAPIYDFGPLFINIAGAYQGNNMMSQYKGGYATKATYISSLNSKAIASGTNEALSRVNMDLLNSELDTLLSAEVPINNISLTGKVPKTEPSETTVPGQTTTTTTKTTQSTTTN